MHRETVVSGIEFSREEHQLLSKMASDTDQSLGRLIRELVYVGATVLQPPLAEAIRQARVHHREIVRGTIHTALALSIGWLSVFGDTDFARRVRRSRRDDITTVSELREEAA